MRKVMLLAAMLAMVLAAGAPAFAQAVGGDVSVQYVDCSQVQAAAAAQGQYGDASADADASAGDVGSAANAEAVASIAQELGITQAQVNACLGGITSASPSPPASVPTTSASTPPGVLPDTGGASLFALGAGALLVAGGLLARRIVR
jgi:hypothetical protein